MSFFISALVLILLVLLFVFLGVGLAIILGVILVIAAVFAAINFIFGGRLTGKEVPQKFNECLIEEQPEDCLKDWTTWDQDKLDVIKILAKQVKNDLGIRGASRSTEYMSETNNGQQTIRMELITDYEKKQDVHEHYVLLKQDGDLKIHELKWDY